MIKTEIISKKLFRVIAKSLKNIFFPYKGEISKYITIEVSSICDAKCIFCNYRFGYRTKKIMSLEDFKCISESCIKLGYEGLGLTSMGGELFVHKDAVEIIKTAKNAGFKYISTFTNGILIHKHNVEGLLKSGIDELLISFPGFSEKLYKEIFQVNLFNDFKKSITILLETHKKLNSNVIIKFEPRTYLTKNQIKQNEFYLNSLKNYISDRVYIDEPLRFFDTWGGMIKQEDLKKGMKIDINPLKSIYPFKKIYPCYRLLRFNILVNGNVRLCNCRYDSTIETAKDTLNIDNLEKYKNLQELLLENKAKINKIRLDFIKGQMPELCKKCPFYMPTDFNKYWDYVRNENISDSFR